ncbi:MAG TPA: HipA domain-containing protein, partial [Cellvibrionaceae bacterium]|nr:HipA domain-containing protein [Cellvibrionaceae bacterium]
MHKFTVWAPAPRTARVKLALGNWAPAGELDFASAGCTFRYLQSWLQTDWAYSLDPVHLPLAPAIYYPKTQSQLLPLFANLIPAGRAALLLKNALKLDPLRTLPAEFKLMPGGLNPIRLSLGQQPLGELNLPAWEELENYCQKDREQIGYNYPLARFTDYMAGGCWRGERPKLTVRGSDKLWLAKWQLKDEAINWPQIEYACLELLQQAGLSVPQRHLIPTDACGWLYLIERFDQLANNPVYFISAEVLLGQPKAASVDGDARRDPGSYIALARCVRKYSSNAKADLLELYRRLLANIMLNNTQDHLHKFG